MAVRIIKGSWWADISHRGKRYRIRSPENSRASALVYESTLRQKLSRGDTIDRLQDDIHQNPLFEQFAWRWFDEYVKPNNKYSVQRMERYVLGSLLIPFFGKIPVANIASCHIEQYEARRVSDGLSNKTIKSHLTVLSKCLNTGYEWLNLESSPPRIRWPKCPPPHTDYLSLDECELLLSNADGTIQEMILVALRTGMRQGELKGLQWNSIDWQNMTVTVRHSRCDRARDIVSPKNNRIRHIPLVQETHRLLHRKKREVGYVFTDARGRPFHHGRLSSELEKVCKKAGMRRITWHILRHTFATQLAMKGVPLHVVQALLGHSTITMTMRYAHVAPSALRSAVEVLDSRQSSDRDFGQPAGNPLLHAKIDKRSDRAAYRKTP